MNYRTKNYWIFGIGCWLILAAIVAEMATGSLLSPAALGGIGILLVISGAKVLTR